MNKQLFLKLFLAGFVFSIFIFGPEIFARDLIAASTQATNLAKNVGRSISALGVVSGGILMQIPGASFFGRQVLTGGLVGCLCTFGGPALINMMGNIFGGN